MWHVQLHSACPLGQAPLQRREAQGFYGHLHLGGQEVAGSPMPDTLLHGAVKVHELRAAQLNILSDEGGGRSL